MASFLDVAVSDMRQPSGAWAIADDVWWLRFESGFKYGSSVQMGDYPNPLAFNPAYNPYAAEVAWANTPPTNQTTWSRMNQWYHAGLGETYTLNHAPGWINNTYVMVWGHELWIKSRATGNWTRRVNDLNLDGGWIDPNIVGWQYPSWSLLPNDSRLNPETGYREWRMVYPTTGEWPYLGIHAWSTMITIDPYDVGGVISLFRSSLTVRDPAKSDDRDSSRFLLAAGSDYMPDDSRVVLYPGCGGSRMKFVRAKWPNWQFHVMHTMTEAQIRASGGCPAELLALSEGGGAVEPPPGPGPGGTTIIAPTVGEWQPLLVSGKAAWGASGVTGSPSGKIRRRRGIVLME